MTKRCVSPGTGAAPAYPAVRHAPAVALFLGVLAASVACQSAPAPIAPLTPTPRETLVPGDALDSPPAGWSVYRDRERGFGFWYPATADLVQATTDENARIEFASSGPNNVVEESLTVRAEQNPDGCPGPLTLEFDPAQLQSEDLQLGGIDFVKQIHSGAAAGTATTRVDYTTSRGSLCVTLDFVLSTYDVANLDPTQFPTLPPSVDPTVEFQRFEDLAATFRWLP